MFRARRGATDGKPPLCKTSWGVGGKILDLISLQFFAQFGDEGMVTLTGGPLSLSEGELDFVWQLPMVGDEPDAPSSTCSLAMRFPNVSQMGPVGQMLKERLPSA